MMLRSTQLTTPLGDVSAAYDGALLVALTFTDHWPRVVHNLARHGAAVEPDPVDRASLQQALNAYFAGDLAALDAIAIAPLGTPFQRAVWSALREIRPGSTRSYGELARRIGAPKAVRAVGAANGANPIWLVVPCHRAIGSDGSLTGYAGGLERKRWLLRHEGALAEFRFAGALKNTENTEPRPSPTPMNTEPNPT
jgi:methylated-DNA-[protein]-cysteine S-methyltransferase